MGDALTQSAYNVYMKSKDPLLQAKFSLNKFESNSSELVQMINGKVNELSIAKILGLLWDKVPMLPLYLI